MGRPAARQGDPVNGIDTHIVLVPAPPGAPVPTPLPHPFAGRLLQAVSANVRIDGRAAATVGSVAPNQPPHVPTPPGTAFTRPPHNRGTVSSGSPTVLINGKGAARQGDQVRSCNDPVDQLTCAVTAGSARVLIE